MKNVLTGIAVALVFLMLSFSIVSAESSDNGSDSKDIRDNVKSLREDARNIREDMQNLREQMREQRQLRGKQPVNVEDINESASNSSDVKDSLKDLQDKDNLKRIGFAESNAGTGWITDNSEGFVVGIAWVEQSFAQLNKTSGQVENSNITKTIGRLSVESIGTYKLVLTSSSNSSLTFDVFSQEDKPNLENATSIGTLTLNEKTSPSNLNVYDGTLTLNGGDISGTWDVNVATHSSTLKGNAFEGNKKGFFQRLMFWRK